MDAVEYRIRVGDTQLGPEPLDGRLTLVTDCHMSQPTNACVVTLARGRWPGELARGMPFEVELGHSDRLARIFTGILLSIDTRRDLRMTAVSQNARVVDARVNLSWPMSRAGDVMRHAVLHCGLRPGHIDAGPQFWGYVIHGGTPFWAQLEHLARQCGFDLYCDTHDRVVFTDGPGREAPRIARHNELIGGPVPGSVVRSVQRATHVEGWGLPPPGSRSLAAPRTRGTLRTQGRSDIALGAALHIPGSSSHARPLAVVGVRHEVSPKTGFRTDLEWLRV